MRFCFFLALVGLLLPLTATAQQARVQAALHYLDQHATTLGLAEEDVDEVMVTDAYTSRRSGLTHVYVRQAIGGIEVVGTEMTINVDANDRVIHRAGTFRTDLLSEARVRQPALNAQQAVQRAATHVGLSAPSALRVMESNNDPSQAVALAALEADNPIRARLVYAPDQNDALHLAWEVELAQRSQKDYWLVYVDAATGAEVRRVSLTVSESFGEAAHAHDAAVPSFAPIQERTAPAAAALVGSYKVFEAPVEAPIYASPASPADGRTTAVNPDDATASPFGWHDTNGSAGAEFTTTQGNNVHAYTDTDANNSPDAGSAPDGGAGLSFDFPVDFTAAPSTYRPAAVTNLFYWNNIIHDVLYQYGFDEAGGNFQTNTYGNGGSGNDHVLAEAQDGSGTNNANFSTPSDGSAPRMQMFIGTNPSPDVDGDFDNAVIVHEYGHGVSNRLTGGPNNVGCLSNSEQMGEGWSDYYGMMFTMDANDTPTQARGIGNYLFGQSTNGGGIRPAPYSTSFGTNGFTYQDTRTQIAPHGVGFVWATILWEVTWDLIDAHGFDADLYNAGGTAGNQIMLNLVTEGMKLQPCSPGFVDGRDAILAADAALYGGANTDMLWAAFARRGLGLSASQGSVFTNSDNTEAFDVPTTGGNTPPDASFTFSCTALDCTFTDTSSDSDGTIASRAWTFGDGGTSSATNPAHTYAADGTYTVGLTVTDDDGDSDTASQSVTVTSGGGGDPIALSGVARNNGRKWFADLTWTPSDGGRLDVYLDGAVVKTTRDDGFFSYNLGRNASGSYDFQVCEQDSGDCSNVATVNVDGVMAADGPASSLGAGEETPETTLLGAYPNPFNGSTRIGFSLAERAEVSLEVYNSLGQRVAVLASGTLEAGPHQTIFDASALPSGVYLYRLHTGETVETGRLMLVR